MNKLLVNYQEDILLLFKGHYKRLITKSVQLSFEDVLKETLLDLNIKESNVEDTYFLKSWFNQVHHQSFFMSLRVRNLLKSFFTLICMYNSSGFLTRKPMS